MEPKDLPEVIKQIEEDERISQAEVARRLEMTPQNLSHVLKGRRKLPAEAAIELFDLTGIHPKKLLEMSKKLFAAGGKSLAGLATISLLISGGLLTPTPAKAAPLLEEAPPAFLLCKVARELLGQLKSSLSKVLSKAKEAFLPLGICQV